MSIYISGMDMPKSCSECFADDNGWCNILGCSIGNSVALRMIERRRDCPLVEVPPHGALGDLEALYKKMIALSDNNGAHKDAHPDDSVILRDSALYLIDAADTIIPADPAEEGAE